MLTKRQFLLILEKYQESVKEYLQMSKHEGFKFMEELVAEIEDEEGLEWSDAYDTFNDMVSAVIMSKYKSVQK